jgi:general stress protein 26
MRGPADDTAQLWSLIEKNPVAMVVTTRPDGLRARPMSARPNKEDGVIYFLTDANAPKRAEIEADDFVCLAFADTREHCYVSVSGRAAFSEDRDKIRDIWSAYDKAFWRDADDPRVRLMTVRPDMAEYWRHAGAVSTIVKILASTVSGAAPTLGDNKKVTIYSSARR